MKHTVSSIKRFLAQLNTRQVSYRFFLLQESKQINIFVSKKDNAG